MVFGDGTDADVVAFADDELEAAVQVFHVRGGRVRGQRGWIVEKSGDPEDSGQGHLVEQFLTQFYGDQAELGGAARRVDQPGATPDPGAGAAAQCRRAGDLVVRASRITGGAAGAACAATSGRWPRRSTQRAGCADAAQAQAGRRFHCEIRCTAEHSGSTRAGRCPVADRVRRHQPRAGHRRGGVPRGVRGRSAAQVRLPALRDPGGRRRRAFR